MGVWKKKVRIRFARLNAPEKATAAGLSVIDKITPILKDKPVILQTKKDRNDPYGRLLAEIEVSINGVPTNLSDWMLSNNLAVPYPPKK